MMLVSLERLAMVNAMIQASTRSQKWLQKLSLVYLMAFLDETGSWAIYLDELGLTQSVIQTKR